MKDRSDPKTHVLRIREVIVDLLIEYVEDHIQEVPAIANASIIFFLIFPLKIRTNE